MTSSTDLMLKSSGSSATLINYKDDHKSSINNNEYIINHIAKSEIDKLERSIERVQLITFT